MSDTIHQSRHSFSRRAFLKTIPIVSSAAAFTGSTGCSRLVRKAGFGGKQFFYYSDFIPQGALFKLAFVCDHHYWPEHFKDWGGGTQQTRHSEERMHDLVKTLNEEKPDISIHAGDVISAGGSFEPPLPEYVKELDFEKRMIDGLHHPVIPIVGNHEIPRLLYKDESELDQWKERFGPLYRYEDIRGWRLVALNSIVPNPGNLESRGNIYGIDDGQMEWLRVVLKEAASKRLSVLLFSHVPPGGFVNEEEFKTVINAPGCVRGMFCGHFHRNNLSMLGNVPVMVRVGNAMSPLGYTIVYPYSDGRIVVVQKSQHFPFLDFVSNGFRSGAQGEENDRYFTLGGSSELPLDGLEISGDGAKAGIFDGHLRLQSDGGKAFVLFKEPGLDNVRISFSAVKEKASRMGVIAYTDDGISGGVEGTVTGLYSSDGQMFLADTRGKRRETLDR